MRALRAIATMTPVLLATACGGSRAPSDSPGAALAGAPEWVLRGSRVDKGTIVGVGSASGIKNTELARSTAANRGRAEISKILEVYSASLMKDYQESVTAGDMKSSSESQLVTQAIKTFSANTLNGVEIVDHWIHPQSGEIYALARLDIAGFMDQIDKAKELNAKVKDAVKRSAEKAFSDLDAEEAKAEARKNGE